MADKSKDDLNLEDYRIIIMRVLDKAHPLMTREEKLAEMYRRFPQLAQ